MCKDNIFIGVVIIIAIIVFLIYYKSNNKKDYFDNALTNAMITVIDNDIASCFSGETNLNFKLFSVMNNNFIRTNQNELLEKMKEITLPGIILMTRFVRLSAIDTLCKNNKSNNQEYLSYLFFTQVKQLIKLFNQVYNVISDGIGYTRYDEATLLKEIICLYTVKIPLDDQHILSDPDSIEYPESISARILNTYNIFIFSQDIYNLIINFAQNKETSYCKNFYLTEPQFNLTPEQKEKNTFRKLLLPVYRMYPEGNLKSCKVNDYIPIRKEMIESITSNDIKQMQSSPLTSTSSGSSGSSPQDAPSSTVNPNELGQYQINQYDNNANYNNDSYSLTDTNVPLLGASGSSDLASVSSSYDLSGAANYNLTQPTLLNSSSGSSDDSASSTSSSIYYSGPFRPSGLQNNNTNVGMNNYNYGYSTSGSFQYIKPDTNPRRNRHRHHNLVSNQTKPDFNIKLENSKGYNNFFKPSIYISV